MKRTLLYITMIVGLLASTGLADEKERQGDRRKGRREAARKSTSANQPRRSRRTPKRKQSGKARTDVLIYQFKHIHVDSFIGTLEQLARSKHVAPHLKDVPHAINEESNTLVMLAPPELTRLVKQIAEGVDKPNPREARRRGKGLEQSRHRPMGRFGVRRSGGQGECPMMGRHSGGKPPWAGRDDDDERGERKGRRGDRREQNRPKGREKESAEHRPAMVGMLLHPRLGRALKLNEKQIGRIREIVKDLHGKMAQLSKRLRNARKDSRSEEANRKMRNNARRRMMQFHKEAAEKIDKILTGDQKEQWQKLSKQMRRPRKGRDGDRWRPRRRRDDDPEDDEEEDEEEDRGRRGRRHRDGDGD